jgi:hypothetical protein
LQITQPGVYENYRVDAQGAGGNVVKITADDVTVRNCEIFNGSGNAIGVFGTRVVIENCRIHHLLSGTFSQQADAHGITGRWGEVTIRNCDIFRDNEIALRVRGPGERGGAHVRIRDCAIYDTQTGVRAEDRIEQLQINGLAFGPGVRERVRFVNGRPGPGYENTGEHDAPPLETPLK